MQLPVYQLQYMYTHTVQPQLHTCDVSHVIPRVFKV